MVWNLILSSPTSRVSLLSFFRELDPVLGQPQPCLFIDRVGRPFRQLPTFLGFVAKPFHVVFGHEDTADWGFSYRNPADAQIFRGVDAELAEADRTPGTYALGVVDHTILRVPRSTITLMALALHGVL